ncbi:hypothetical protein [Nocardia brasiliensis]|uniref:hypothetical protein n=1 Tax=Nocardia brasiliensis TaxID=37326 RepID=UPI003D8C6B37
MRESIAHAGGGAAGLASARRSGRCRIRDNGGCEIGYCGSYATQRRRVGYAVDPFFQLAARVRDRSFCFTDRPIDARDGMHLLGNRGSAQGYGTDDLGNSVVQIRDFVLSRVGHLGGLPCDLDDFAVQRTEMCFVLINIGLLRPIFLDHRAALRGRRPTAREFRGGERLCRAISECRHQPIQHHLNVGDIRIQDRGIRPAR